MIDQHASLSEKFLKKGVWLYFFSFIMAPIWYTIKIIVSWELSVEEIWILYWILSFIILLSSFNDFWMVESLNYFIPKYSSQKSYDKIKSILFYAFVVQLITWVIIACILFFGADFLSTYYFKSDQAKWIIQIFSLYFLWVNLFRIIATFFLALQNTLFNKLTEFIKILFTLVSIIVMLFLDIWSLQNYSIAWIIWLYFWVIFAVSAFYFQYHKKYFRKEKIILSIKLIKTIFSYAILVFVWAQAWTILSQIDMQMVIYMLWTEDAGYYTNYLSIISIPFMILWPIMLLLFPVFSELYDKKQLEQIQHIKKVFQKNFLVIIIAFNALFFVFSEFIAFILFWEKFIISWTIVKYSVLFLMFNFMLQLNFHIFAWTWKVKERVKIILIAIVFNFFANIIFIKLIWVYWAAFATSLWWLLIWVLSEIRLSSIFRSSFDWIFIVKNLLIIWVISVLSHYFIIDSITNLSRIDGLIFMFLFSSMYMLIILWYNKKDILFLFSQIRKMRR